MIRRHVINGQDFYSLIIPQRDPTMTIIQLINDLAHKGGALVSSGDCSEMEILFAQREDRFSVYDNGFGFVRRSKEWVALQKHREAEARSRDLATSILFTDPETSEELRPDGAPTFVDSSLVLTVINRDGSRKWKHTIKTEEQEPLSPGPYAAEWMKSL